MSSRAKRSSRRAPVEEEEEEEEVEYEEEVSSSKTKRGKGGGRRKPDSDDEAEAEEDRRPALKKQRESGDDGAVANGAPASSLFKLYNLGGTYPVDPLCSPDDIADSVKPKEKDKAEALAADELKKLIGKMTRYLLMRGSKKLPIFRAKLTSEVMGDYKKVGITMYTLGEAQRKLRDVWGYDLVPAPPRCGGFVYKGSLKDAWYVVHRLRSPGHSAMSTAALTDDEKARRGLLVTVLAMVQSKQNALKEKELYSLLNRMDPNIPDDPGNGKEKGLNVPRLGQVAQLIDSFREQHYIVKERDGEDEMIIYLGPRALVDMGRYQITQFQADCLGQSIDAAILKELDEENMDEEEEPEAEPEQEQQQAAVAPPKKAKKTKQKQ